MIPDPKVLNVIKAIIFVIDSSNYNDIDSTKD